MHAKELVADVFTSGNSPQKHSHAGVSRSILARTIIHKEPIEGGIALETTKDQGASNRWLVFVVTLLGCMCIFMSLYKVTGTMSFIKSEWGLNVTSAGMLMSSPAMATLIVSLPAGSLIRKFGPRKMFLFALINGMVFNAAGAFAGDFNMLAITRFLEGISTAFALIAPPVIYTQIFPAEKRGLPMSIWSCAMVLGTWVILNAENLITPVFGWHANWWAVVIFYAIAFVLNFFFLKLPKHDSGSGSNQGKAQQKTKGGWGQCLKNPALICLCIILFAVSFGLKVYTAYYPTYLQSVFGLTSAVANSVSTVHTYEGVIIGLTFGFVMNKVANKNHPKLLLFACVCAMIGFSLMWEMPNVVLGVVAIIIGCLGSKCANPLCRNLVPNAVSAAALVPIGMSCLSFCSGASGILAPMISGAVVDATGSWAAVAVVTGVTGLIAVIAGIVVIKTMPKSKFPETEN